MTDAEIIISALLLPRRRYLYNTDTSVKRILGSAPLVSVLKRFDCVPKGKDCIWGRSLPTESLPAVGWAGGVITLKGKLRVKEAL